MCVHEGWSEGRRALGEDEVGRLEHSCPLLCGTEWEPVWEGATREMGGIPRGRLGRTGLLLKTLKWTWMFHPKRPRQSGATTRLTTWLRKDEHVLKTEIVGGRSRFGHTRRTPPRKLVGTLSPRGSAGRSVSGFSDCEDIAFNDRATAASETQWSIPHRKPPEAVLDESVNRPCKALQHSQVCPDRGVLALPEDSEKTS